jgi:sulfate adenylyltransferase large subunit
MATAGTSPISPVATSQLLASKRGILRFTTAGSVDDGKSTLIGRLLYDSRAVYEDQLTSIRKSRINRSSGSLDLSLLTDGLRAEREQGITIDVAYRYFSTAKRKFIIADTPGHEQYTRNMVTGASTADAAVILLDATKGVLSQSRRHAYIAHLLGIKHIVAAVNKMDLVGYSQQVFEHISWDFRTLCDQLALPDVYSLPLSALEGDNVVERSPRMGWFAGPALLEYLEEVAVENGAASAPARFPIQYVIRPNSHFRGYAGQVASGVFQPGQSVVALPSGVKTRVKSIVTYDGELQQAGPGSSIALTLQDEIDLSRGDLLAAADALPSMSRKLKATVVWLHFDPLDVSKSYLLKQAKRTVRGRAARIQHRVEINSFARVPARTLEMNDIGEIDIETTLPLFFDPYRRIPTTGCFILIDPLTNATVAAGMIEGAIADRNQPRQSGAKSSSRISSEERRLRWGHSPAVIWVADRPQLAELVERSLFEERWNTLLLGSNSFEAEHLLAVCGILKTTGAVVVFSGGAHMPEKQAIRELFGEEAFFEGGRNGSDAEEAAQMVERLNRWRELDAAQGKEQI